MAGNVKKKEGVIERLRGRSYAVFADGLGILMLLQLVNSPMINKLATLPLICAIVVATFVALMPSHAKSNSNLQVRPRKPGEHWTAVVPRPSEWQSYRDG